MVYLEKRKHSEIAEELNDILPRRKPIPKDILEKCRSGCPGLMVSFHASNDTCDGLRQILRKTDVVQERNGVVTLLIVVRNKQDVPVVSEKVEKFLAMFGIRTILSITYLDI